jgi:hypothetical protein
MQYYQTKSLALVIVVAALGLISCGGSDSPAGPPPTFTVQIASDPAFDGDIQQTSPTTFTVTQGMSPTVQSVFAGIDPATLTEFRAFLDFPLGGAGGIPATANIDSAALEIYINSLQPGATTLPILIELVNYQPPTLLQSDFDRSLQPPLAYVRVNPPFASSDVGTYVSIDVTSLMSRAQELGLVDFELRILEDLGPGIPGLIEINDTTGANRGSLAPLLTVTYF